MRASGHVATLVDQLARHGLNEVAARTRVWLAAAQHQDIALEDFGTEVSDWSAARTLALEVLTDPASHPKASDPLLADLALYLEDCDRLA